MESTFNFLKISINGFSWCEHIADQEDQTTADKKRKQQQKHTGGSFAQAHL